jgi:predicted AAA+ superfamily ATPase
VIVRNVDVFLRGAAAAYPVVTVTGPRQSGKTTACRAAFPHLSYVSLEPLDVREHATRDPRSFLADQRAGAILDEVQHAPGLLSYLQEEVDRDPRAGRFVLTGSQHFGLSAAIGQSLAGRTAVLHLLPPSLDELRRFPDAPTELWATLWAGAYPRIHDQHIEPNRWLADYVTTYVERDVRQIAAVGDLAAFTTFVRLTAASTACELNLSRLGSDTGITHNTARAWLGVLEASFIALRVPAWTATARKQSIRAPKLHFLDSGLVCYLLGIRTADQLRLHPLRGAIFESWVVSEIVKARYHRGEPASTFHYRETRGAEIDAVVDGSSTLRLVEAKSGATFATDMLTPLRRTLPLARSRAGSRAVEPYVVHGGERRETHAETTVLPWSMIQDVDWADLPTVA